MTLRAPKSGEQLDQIAPIEAQARKAGHRLRDVRQVRGDAVALADSERAEPGCDAGGAIGELGPGHLGEGPQLGRVPDRDRVRVVPAKHVLCVVEPRRRGTTPRRASPATASTRPTGVDERTSKCSQIAPQKPSRSSHRPVPERLRSRAAPALWSPRPSARSGSRSPARSAPRPGATGQVARPRG